MLSARQQLLLRRVIESHVELGQPVGSKWLTEQSDITWSASTVRYELHALEQAGYLDHPHTSAGRIPTEAGYRLFADSLLRGGLSRRENSFELELSSVRREVDFAMRRTTETLSRVTDLFAAVSAPPSHTATVRHVEALLLQPTALLVVVISSTGAVTKRAFNFERDVDRGLVDWASSYLNERLSGMDLGTLMLRSRLDDEALSTAERDFIDTIKPAFDDLADTTDDTIYIEGTSRLVAGGRFTDIEEMNDLMRMLERRVTLLSVLRATLDEPAIYLRIGHENAAPELRSASVVAASYGLGHRTLGAVSVIGPVRMDYRQAIESVREAATALSHFVEEVYE